MGKKRRAIAKMFVKQSRRSVEADSPEKERLMDGLGGWPTVSVDRKSRTARNLGVGEEEKKKKIANNRTEEENERDLAP